MRTREGVNPTCFPKSASLGVLDIPPGARSGADVVPLFARTVANSDNWDEN